MICPWSIQGIPGSPASGLDAAAGASTSDLMGDMYQGRVVSSH